ncbi:Uncharacterised protein [Xylophilus ampelinus]|nr:Uncharacterised protein [Xylophilus ampelinus]
MAQYQSHLNEQGTQGYRLVYTAPGLSPSDHVEMWVKDQETSYAYEGRAVPFDIRNIEASYFPALLSTLNAAGAAGWSFVRSIGSTANDSQNGFVNWVMFQKSKDTAFEYTMIDVPQTLDSYVSQSNALGQQGYRLWTEETFGSATKMIFMREITSLAQYAVQAVRWDSLAQDYAAFLNVQGAQGWRLQFRPSHGWGEDVFVKDTTQAATFEHTIQTSPGSELFMSQGVVDQANAQAAQGWRYFRKNLSTAIYLRSTGCSGTITMSLCLTASESQYNLE